MKSNSVLVASVLTATGYSAATASQWTPSGDGTGTGQTFSLSQIRNEKFTKVKPVEALLSAYARYAEVVPLHIQRLVSERPEFRAKFTSLSNSSEVVSAQAKPPLSYDSEYVLPLDLGTPPQTVPINLDTGSSDLWVFSSETNPSEVMGQTLYRPENSNTSRKLSGETWQVKYGDNSTASGNVYADRAAIGPVGYDKQAVQVATEISSSIAADNFFSGILGMASSNANTVRPDKQLTFFDNVKGKLAKPLFTANLKKGRPGNYNFGYIDKSEYSDDIAYTAIDPSTPYWMVELDGYMIGDGDDDDIKGFPIKGIVDTGTSLMMVPDSVIKEYYATIPGSFLDAKEHVMMFPCSSTPPDFTFAVGDYRGVIPGSYINYAPYKNGSCFGGLQSSKDLPFAIFGDILIKAQFVVFDQGKLRVGFANKLTD